MNAAKLEKLKENVRIGGKGSVRRKHKGARKVAAGDDKKLHATLKRLGVNPLPQVEEVCIYKEDGNVLIFQNPKVQASIAANTYVVSGACTEKKAELQDILPSLFGNLPPEQLKKIQELANNKAANVTADDEVPELVETFDSAKTSATPATDAKVEELHEHKEHHDAPAAGHHEHHEHHEHHDHEHHEHHDHEHHDHEHHEHKEHHDAPAAEHHEHHDAPAAEHHEHHEHHEHKETAPVAEVKPEHPVETKTEQHEHHEHKEHHDAPAAEHHEHHDAPVAVAKTEEPAVKTETTS